jgi:hypothetical protein
MKPAADSALVRPAGAARSAAGMEAPRRAASSKPPSLPRGANEAEREIERALGGRITSNKSNKGILTVVAN